MVRERRNEVNQAGEGQAGAERAEGKGLLAIVAAVMAFSWGFVLVKIVPLPAAQLGFMRLIFSVVILGPLAWRLRIPWPRLSVPVVGAGVMFGLHQLLFISATQHTSIAIVTLIGALQPLLVSMVSRRTIGEVVPLRLVLSSLLALVGVTVVVQANLGDSSRSLYGDALSVVNLLVFVAYFLFSRTARDRGGHTLTFTTTVFAIAAVIVAPALLLSGGAQGGVRVPTLAEGALVLLMAMGPGNGHLLVNWAHTRVSAALSSLVLAMVPLLSSIWAAIVFGEPYGPRHVAGMLLVIAAIEGGRRAERRRRDEPDEVAEVAPYE